MLSGCLLYFFLKRLHEYKVCSVDFHYFVNITPAILQRQTLNILGVIHRYLTLKKMTPEERKKVNPRVVFFAGKAAPGCKSI